MLDTLPFPFTGRDLQAASNWLQVRTFSSADPADGDGCMLFTRPFVIGDIVRHRVGAAISGFLS